MADIPPPGFFPAYPTTRDTLVRDARSVPDLIAKAKTVDPALAEQLTGKALFTSKSPPGIAIAAVIAWASTKYGFGWDEATVDMLTLVSGVVAAYAMRAITSAPIASLFSKPTVPIQPTK